MGCVVVVHRLRVQKSCDVLPQLDTAFGKAAAVVALRLINRLRCIQTFIWIIGVAFVVDAAEGLLILQLLQADACWDAAVLEPAQSQLLPDVLVAAPAKSRELADLDLGLRDAEEGFDVLLLVIGVVK